ncbi:hypothetical protein POVWA1_037530 [Plasmodium ovale wallikeri]|uniref:Uncharacterized protein n=1 Tax=Plasmodium ovale wallikeri TaxID=864142 RepID=A0A1A8Z2Y1_PLAOA|nr:hypothetical protein POVWA1_037530 [Plasmodium ovale wallikeri]
MVDINEIEFIEETEYFKFQHGSCFCMSGDEKKEKGKNDENVEEKLLINNFTISNVMQKGIYFFKKKINIFSLSDFLYKIDNDSANINIKLLPFEENVLLIENDKNDYLSFIYTDKQNIYVFDYGTDQVKLHCKVNIRLKAMKHISRYNIKGVCLHLIMSKLGLFQNVRSVLSLMCLKKKKKKKKTCVCALSRDDSLLLLLSEDERVLFMKEEGVVHECTEFSLPVSAIDEKNGIFLFAHSGTESFILKDEYKTELFKLNSISEKIHINYERCSIICAKILETSQKKRKLFIVVLYKEADDMTSVTYDLQIEDYEIRRVNYSINDFFFEKNDESNYIKCMYITEWKIVVTFSSQSCEVVIYTHNKNLLENENSNDLKILCIKEGYKINTRKSDTFFLSMFMYSKYVDKIYRKSKLGNVPFLKNPVVFFLLQNNTQIVVEYLDQYKLEDNTNITLHGRDIFLANETGTNECDMQEVTLLHPLTGDVIETYLPTKKNVLAMFKTKELANTKVETSQPEKDNMLNMFRSKNKPNEGSSAPIMENDQWSAPIKKTDQWSAPIKKTDHWSAPIKKTDQWSAPIKKNDQWSAPIKKNDQWSAPIKKNDQRSAPIKKNDQRSVVDNRDGEVKLSDASSPWLGEEEKYNVGDVNKERSSMNKLSETNEEDQHKYENIKKTIYEDKYICVQKLQDKYNKFVNCGMFSCEDFLLNENVYAIEKEKVPKMGRKKKECFYDKTLGKVVFLDDQEGGNRGSTEGKDGSTVDKKEGKKKKKSEFYNYFHCEDFDFYKHEKLSDMQCERIIKKIEKKQQFLFDIREVFMSDQGDNANGHHQKARPRDAMADSGEKKASCNEKKSSCNEKKASCYEKKARDKKGRTNRHNRHIQVDVPEEHMNKFYKELDSYFSKKKLLKVNSELVDAVKSARETNMSWNIFEIVCYNIFRYSDLKYCEALIYFILKNAHINTFSSSFFLLDHYFSNLLMPYVHVRGRCNPQVDAKRNKLKNQTILEKMNCDVKRDNSSASIHDEKGDVDVEGVYNLDSDYSTDNYCEDDIHKKIKNEKNEKKKKELISKIIPIFKEEIKKEEELAQFLTLNYSIDFLNNRLCYFLSQNFLPIILDNNLNTIDDRLHIIKNYLFNFILSENHFSQNAEDSFAKDDKQ